MVPSREEKSHTNGAQEITKSVNRSNLCLPTASRAFRWLVLWHAETISE